MLLVPGAPRAVPTSPKNYVPQLGPQLPPNKGGHEGVSGPPKASFMSSEALELALLKTS